MSETENVCGRASVSLRGSLQSQVGGGVFFLCYIHI